jgi:hypothetical protein
MSKESLRELLDFNIGGVSIAPKPRRKLKIPIVLGRLKYRGMYDAGRRISVKLQQLKSFESRPTEDNEKFQR